MIEAGVESVMFEIEIDDTMRPLKGR